MKRFIPITVAVALLMLAVALYVFFWSAIAAAVAATAAARTEASAESTQELFRKSVSGLLNGTAADRASLASFVATDQTAVAIIQELESAGARENVAVSIGAVSAAASDWQYHDRLEIQLSARGSFAALAAFATDLESLPQASHLVSMSIQSTAHGVWSGTFTVDFVKQKSLQTP